LIHLICQLPSNIVKVPFSELCKCKDIQSQTNNLQPATSNKDEILQIFLEALRLHSFVVVTLSDKEASVLEDATNKAHDFFTQCTAEEKKVTKKLFKEVGESLGLVGYNMVSAAKEVYRIRRGDEQPWPTNHDEFKQSVLSAFDILEKVVHTCFELMVTSVGLSPSSLLLSCGDPSPLPPETFSSSPFDLFHYFNQEPINDNHDLHKREPSNNETNNERIKEKNTDNKKRTNNNNSIPPNCYEHVDPGMLTCVPCTTTPGLEIVDREDGEWFGIEKYLEPFRDISVFTARSLQYVSGNEFPAAIHRVEKDQKNTPRLSLVYELRPKAGFDITTLQIT